MALVERLMGLEDSKIQVHDFFAANSERIASVLTRQDVIDMFAMDAATITEYDLLANQAPVQDAQRALFLEMIHSVFILAESRRPGYTTPALVRARLGL